LPDPGQTFFVYGEVIFENVECIGLEISLGSRNMPTGKNAIQVRDLVVDISARAKWTI